MKSKVLLLLVIGFVVILGGCSGGSKPRNDVAEVTVTEPQEAEETEAAIQGNDDASIADAANPEGAEVKKSASVVDDAAKSDGAEIKKGANLVAVLRSAKSVSYEYNSDSGIWAHIGNLSIIIDEDQLNQKGIEFLTTIYSDIEPNLKFSPDYVKPDAKILKIEKN